MLHFSAFYTRWVFILALVVSLSALAVADTKSSKYFKSLQARLIKDGFDKKQIQAL